MVRLFIPLILKYSNWHHNTDFKSAKYLVRQHIYPEVLSHNADKLLVSIILITIYRIQVITLPFRQTTVTTVTAYLAWPGGSNLVPRAFSTSVARKGPGKEVAGGSNRLGDSRQHFINISASQFQSMVINTDLGKEIDKNSKIESRSVQLGSLEVTQHCWNWKVAFGCAALLDEDG